MIGLCVLIVGCALASYAFAFLDVKPARGMWLHHCHMEGEMFVANDDECCWCGVSVSTLCLRCH